MASPSTIDCKRPAPATRAGVAQASPIAWLGSTCALGMLSAVLLWAALPPVSFWPLAWLAPVPWIVLGERDRLSGRHPYRMLWLAGFVFWLATIYWLTLPHWATAFGWLALSFYLALYWPAFVGLLRVAIHQFRWPTIVAAPVIYLGLEMARSHLLTGFTMTGLGHSQYRFSWLIQCADLAGTNGIGCLLVFAAACIVRALPISGRSWCLWPVALLAATLSGVLAYGAWRTEQQTLSPGPHVALIQGSIDITMKTDDSQSKQIFLEYFELSQRAVKADPNLDLIVWPETMFRYPWFTFAPGFQPPADATVTAVALEASSRQAVSNTAVPLGVPVLLGIDTVHSTTQGEERYNSALLVDREGQPQGRYDKSHLVMFGEYVPLARQFPWLYQLTPLNCGLDPGARPVALEIDGVRYAPDICFESTLSHFIRNQVTQLRAVGHEPDVLVNLTNDGWFWGSSELEQHLSCAVFRAVECRKPVLIAANTGISAWIDSNGQIQARGPRRATAVILAHPQLDSRRSPYLMLGDWPAGLALAICVGLAIGGIWSVRGTNKATRPAV